MWVKICGNTNLEDAMRAAELGADAVGFIFAASKRQVTAAQVAAMTAPLAVRFGGSVERIGVFDVSDAETIARTAEEAGLTAVQLHGELNEGLIAQLTERFGGRIEIIQVMHLAVDGGSESVKESLATLSEGIARAARAGLTRVQVDTKVGAAAGGTGVAFDWEAAREVFRAVPEGTRLIVAGGLKPENVGEAIARLQPWGVDVSSGVEAAPGRKDHALIERFLAEAHGVQRP